MRENWDMTRQRERARLARDCTSNGVPPERRRTPLWHRIALGVFLGSLVYLVGSCFFDQRLHAPKIERSQFRFTFEPMP